MNREILVISEQIDDAFQGKPWFGKSVKEILGALDEAIVFEKPNGQHSILELVWHMINWKEYTISRLQKNNQTPAQYFDKNDWPELDHSDKSLWEKGLQRLAEVHIELVGIIRQQTDHLLPLKLSETAYNFRELLYGILQHDIYHLGQIAYMKKNAARHRKVKICVIKVNHQNSG